MKQNLPIHTKIYFADFRASCESYPLLSVRFQQQTVASLVFSEHSDINNALRVLGTALLQALCHSLRVHVYGLLLHREATAREIVQARKRPLEMNVASSQLEEQGLNNVHSLAAMTQHSSPIDVHEPARLLLAAMDLDPFSSKQQPLQASDCSFFLRHLHVCYLQSYNVTCWFHMVETGFHPRCGSPLRSLHLPPLLHLPLPLLPPLTQSWAWATGDLRSLRLCPCDSSLYGFRFELPHQSPCWWLLCSPH